jgi:cell division septation protein DedD
VRDKVVIQRLTQKLEKAGFKTYLVPVGGGLVRVQAGPFGTRAAAVAAVPKVKAAAGGSPIVVAAP